MRADARVRVRRTICFAVACLCAVIGVARAAVHATLDSTTIGIGDAVQLRLERDSESSRLPDLTPLQQDFDVLSTSSTKTMQIINGSTSLRIETIVMLSPKRTGQLTVPAIDWSGESSAPLSLTVTNAGSGNAGSQAGTSAAKKVFIETSADRPDPYLQQAVRVTVRLYMAEPLYRAGMDFPPSNDALIEQIQSDSRHSVVKNGTTYDVVERHYLVFPQRSGTLSIPGPVVEGQIALRMHTDQFGNDPFADLFGAGAGMMTGTKPIRVQGDPLVLNVRARPATAGSGPWLPAQSVTLTGEWRPDSGQVRVGDPITLDLHLAAEGLTATQLPDVTTMLSVPPGLKAYPDQAKLENSQHEDTVLGMRNQSIALIAEQPGEYVVPAVRLAWWDTKANESREVSLPARTLKILPALGGTGTRAAGGTPSASTYGPAGPTNALAPSEHGAPSTSWISSSPAMRWWVGISGVLALLWVVTLFAWRRARRRGTTAAETPIAPAVTPTVMTASQARGQFHDACRRNDAQLARRALLAWVAAAWPGESVPGLEALAKKLDNAAVTERLLELDRACYGGTGWDGSALLALLKDLPRHESRSGGGGSGLAPLYP
jgi:hypothetical protein